MHERRGGKWWGVVMLERKYPRCTLNEEKCTRNVATAYFTKHWISFPRAPPDEDKDLRVEDALE